MEFMGKQWDKLGGDAGMSKPGIGERDTEWHGVSLAELRRSNRGTLTNMLNERGEPKFETRAPAFDLSLSAQQAMQAWHERWAREALRVLKPGGYCLAFGGTRTSHRLACALEDAGFEIRDRILTLGPEGVMQWEAHPVEVDWLYGQGFP